MDRRLNQERHTMSIMRNINYLAKLNTIGCSAPDFFVLVETGFEAAAPALLSLFSPGCTDIVKMKLGHPPFHSRLIKGFLKGAAAPFSVGANQFLYRIGYFTAEAGLYYFMLADIAVQFETTWNSMAFAAEQCPLPSAGTAYGYMAPEIYGPGQDTLMILAAQHTVGGMAVGLHGVSIFPGFQGSFTFSCEFDSWPKRGEGVSCSTWVEEVTQPDPISVSTTNVPPTQPNNETIGHLSFDTLHKLTSTQYICHVQNNGESFAQIVNSTWSVAMSGIAQPVFPWGCKPKKTSIPFT
jgi:hypothetical protein